MKHPAGFPRSPAGTVYQSKPHRASEKTPRALIRSDRQTVKHYFLLLHRVPRSAFAADEKTAVQPETVHAAGRRTADKIVLPI